MTKTRTAFGTFNVIDESNAHLYADDPSTEPLRGYQGRNYEQHPFGSMPWETMPIKEIPRGDWSDMIKEGNANERWALHHHRRMKVPIMNQKQTPYCWINAVAGATMNSRAIHNLPTVNLSAASAGAPGKNYRVEGGWTGEGIGYAKRFGFAPHSMWPNDAIDRRYFEGTREVAKHYNVGQWWELQSKRFGQIMTCLLQGHAVCVGLMWWGHAVYYAAPVEISRNVFGVVCVNSWGDRWENGGMSVLAEEKANADEANTITSPLMDADFDFVKRMKDFWASLSA